MRNNNKLKVYVYAIAKNEAQFVNKWVDSMSEADGIYVMLDGTTTDNTEQLLIQRGVHVKKKIIKPWRFDKARNESLKLVPKDADVCVCTDLDEIFSKGWREVIEEKWIKGETNQAKYKFWHNAWNPNAVPNVFDYSKIHDRNNFYWKWAVHEYIFPKDKNFSANVVFLDGVKLNHYPDLSKKRSYKNILEAAIKKEPNEIRYLQLLAEEYISCGDLNNADRIVARLMKNKNIKYPYDICMTYKMACLVAEKRQQYDVLKKLCYECISKIDYCKWFYAELGDTLVLHLKDYKLGISFLEKALTIQNDVITARETEWNDKARIYNDISIGYYHLQDYKKAIEFIDMAIKVNINQHCVETYENNKILCQNALKNQNNKNGKKQ